MQHHAELNQTRKRTHLTIITYLNAYIRSDEFNP